MPTIVDLDTSFADPARLPVISRRGGGAIVSRGRQPFRLQRPGYAVYLVQQPDGSTVGLTTPVGEFVHEDWIARFQRLSSPATLRRLTQSQGTPLPQWIELALDGINVRDRSGSHQWPVMAMPWPSTSSLVEIAAKLADAGDGARLERLAQNWITAVAAMRRVRFIHGNLTADGMGVAPDGALSLRELDHGWWPGIRVGRWPPEASAYSHPRQPPDRPAGDEFSALVILVSLLALAEMPQLRSRFGAPVTQRGAGLLFHSADLQSGGESELFSALAQSSNARLLALTGVLREAAAAKPEQTPTLNEALAVSRTLTPVIELPNKSPQLKLVETTEIATSTKLDGVVPEAKEIPQDPAWQRADAIHRLKIALLQDDDQVVGDLWPSLRSDAAASVYAIEAEMALARMSSASISRAVEQGNDTGIVEAVASAEALGVAVPHAARRALRAARRRLAGQQQLETALAENDLQTLADIASGGDPDQISYRLDDVTRRRIVTALATLELQQAIERDDDSEIIGALGSVNRRVERFHIDRESQQRVELAVARTGWLERVRAAIKERDGLTLEELLQNQPPDVWTRLSPTEQRRVQRIIEQGSRGSTRRTDQLQGRNSATGGTSARASAEVGRVADRLQRALDHDPVDLATISRTVPRLRDAIGKGELGGNESLQTLLSSADQLLLADAHRTRIEQALESGDWHLIAGTAFPDPWSVVSTLTSEQQSKILKAMEWREAQLDLRPVPRSRD